MRWIHSLCGVGLCAGLAVGSLHAGDRDCPPACPPLWQPSVVMPAQPATPTTPARPTTPTPSTTAPTEPSLFAQAPAAGTAAESLGNPNMLGDFISCQTFFVPPPTGVFDGDEAIRACIPLASRGLFKIAENESPRPQDRVFATYNYFSVRGIEADGSTYTRRISVNIATVGFEKTLLDGRASIGIRVPYFKNWTQADPSTADDGQAVADLINQSNIGDITLVTKFAFLNDTCTGNVLSGGLVVTGPTGPDIHLGIPTGAIDPVGGGPIIASKTINPWLFQPWVGGILNADRFYFHGFTSAVIPSESIDTIYLFNDYGVGFWAYRNCDHCARLSFIVPTVEVHVNTPLNHRGHDHEPIGGIDLIDVTGGVTFGLGSRSTLAFGFVTPVTGPRVFDWEGLVQFNWKF